METTNEREKIQILIIWFCGGELNAKNNLSKNKRIYISSWISPN